MSLYLIILLCSICVPLALSFDKKLRFYTMWKYVLPSILLVAIIFIAWDIYLTHKGVWGFNPRYHSKFKILGLPIEEWLFFFIIPYASLFLHYCFVLYFPNIKLNYKQSNVITGLLILLFSALLVFNLDKFYTIYICGFTIATLTLSFFDKSRSNNYYYITFFLILVPFLMVNSILTGSFIEDSLLWYNENTILGIRIFTIPVEDSIYAFSMLQLNLIFIGLFRGLFNKRDQKYA